MSGPSGCEKHYDVVLDKVKNTFLSSYPECFWIPGSIDGMVPRQTPRSEERWQTLELPGLVDSVVEVFVMLERKRLWEAHKAIVLSNLQEALPASARQFEAYYTEFFLPKFVFRKFDAGFPESRSTDGLEEWLKQLVKEVVATEIPKLMKDNGELHDEELVQMATSHVDEARVQLIERYSPKIKKIVAGIVYKHDLCPPSQDAQDARSFIEDAAQNVCVKILANLESYRFEQPFEHWVARICNNQEICLELVSAVHATSVAMHHHNVVGDHGGKPFSVTGSHSVQPSLSDSRNGGSDGITVWIWKGIHECLLSTGRS